MTEDGEVLWDRFEKNFRDAQSLLQMHDYLTDVLEDGGTRTLGFLQDTIDNSSTSDEEHLGPMIDLLGGLVRTIREETTNEQRRTIILRLCEQAPQAPRDYKGVVDNLHRLHNQVLLELAIVHVVTAFEVYCVDTASSVIQRDETKRAKLRHEIAKDMKGTHSIDSAISKKMSDLGCGEAKAMVIIAFERKKYNIFEGKKVDGLFRLLFGEGLLQAKENHFEKYDCIIQLRHAIVHNKCHVNEKFRRKTGTNMAVGSRIDLDLEYVRDAIDFMDGIATRICMLRRVSKGISAHQNDWLG